VADLHIVREHTLGMEAARQLALEWAQEMETEFRMRCTYQEGPLQDVVIFEGTGAKGTLEVNASNFDLKVKLGFMLGNFKNKIEAVIRKKLDACS
jgi:putative polyhydroxyalkanoate system protein